jgi:Ran GTPase-activating protein (RanGAP) involved in mRNA processing and transport
MSFSNVIAFFPPKRNPTLPTHCPLSWSTFRDLARNTTVKKLFVNEGGANAMASSMAKGMAHVSHTLRVNSCITWLYLGHNQLNSNALLDMVKSLVVNTTVKFLDLQHCSTDGLAGPSFAHLLTLNTSITHLNLAGNLIGGEHGMVVFAKALHTNKTLKTLNLCQNNIGFNGIIFLAAALRVNDSLKHLGLGKNNINAAAMQELCLALMSNTALTHLLLFSNCIEDKGAEALANLLLANSTIVTLDLYANNIKKEGAIALADALHVNCTLTNLSLECNNIERRGGQAIGAALEVNTGLHDLTLGSDHLEAAAICVSKIVTAILTNKTLKFLTLRGIPKIDCHKLALALEGNISLLGLTLPCCHINSDGAIALAGALMNNVSLTQLDLAHNEIDDAGAIALADALKRNSNLTRLDLLANKISFSGRDSFAACLHVNTCLKALHLTRCKFDIQVYHGACTKIAQQNWISALSRNTTLLAFSNTELPSDAVEAQSCVSLSRNMLLYNQQFWSPPRHRSFSISLSHRFHQMVVCVSLCSEDCKTVIPFHLWCLIFGFWPRQLNMDPDLDDYNEE